MPTNNCESFEDDVDAAVTAVLTEERLNEILAKHSKGLSTTAMWIRILIRALKHERKTRLLLRP